MDLPSRHLESRRRPARANLLRDRRGLAEAHVDTPMVAEQELAIQRRDPDGHVVATQLAVAGVLRLAYLGLQVRQGEAEYLPGFPRR